MIHLVTSFFNKNKYGNYEEDILKKRNLEYNNCLINNLKNPDIEKLHLFIENDNSLSILNDILESYPSFKNKVEKILFNKQPLYSDFFDYANNKLKDNIVMISNSDIYLESCDNIKLNKFVNEENHVFCLTRHEHDDSKPLIDKYLFSHDSFIFKSPVSNEIIEKSKFYQNIPGSENVIIYLFSKNNYKLLNPCFQFKIKHLHEINVRDYKGERLNKNRKIIPVIWVKPIII